MNTIGEIFREKRESLKLSVDNICSELKISRNIINQIENDEICEDTQIVFLIGHIRSYSNYLNLNTNEIVEKFKIQNNFNKSNNIDYISKPSFQNNITYLNKVVPGFIITFVFVSFYLLFVREDDYQSNYALVPELPEIYIPIIENYNVNSQVSLTNDIDNENKFNSKNNNSSAVANVPKKLNYEEDKLITLKFLNPTWIQLRDNSNNIIISKLMEKNEEFSYKMNLNYNITSGNAGNILVTLDNNVKGKLGKFGEVIDSFIIDQQFSN